MIKPHHPRVYNIPSSSNFLGELVKSILSGSLLSIDGKPPDATSLAQWKILVPTRRAARALEQIFLDSIAQRALLLPQIRPIGDIDEDTLDIYNPPTTPEEIGLEPAISSLGREFLLIKLINEWATGAPHEPLAQEISISPNQSLNLARSLSRLIDDFEARNMSVGAVPSLYDLELAYHREAIVGFLNILIERYPARLKDLGFIGSIHRRNLLIQREARRLEECKSKSPIIAAGSTGSIEATAELLGIIARLENGAVVLPGLDTCMEKAGWEELANEKSAQAPGHAQYGMSKLLRSLGLSPDQIEVLPGLELNSQQTARVWLTSEIMRPAKIADRWYMTVRSGQQQISSGLEGIEFLEAETSREEAAELALRIRQELENADHTIALVTPDRELAARVRVELSRWGIEVDDSAGIPLARTPEGILLRLLLDVAKKPSDPVHWAALIHHPLALFTCNSLISQRASEIFDLAVLRFLQWRGDLEKLAISFENLPAAIENEPHAHPALRRLSAVEWEVFFVFTRSLIQIIAPLLALSNKGNLRIEDAIESIVHIFEQVAEPNHVWASESGNSLSESIIALRQEGHQLPLVSFEMCCDIIGDAISHLRVRPRAQGGSRLAILGLLEARLIRADLMILAGLNEQVWPAQPDPGPWLNRPMRTKLGLDLPEREIGLAGHDFAQGFGAPRVVLSWSRRLADAPATPSRWLLRLKMIVDAAAEKEPDEKLPPRLPMSLALDEVDKIEPATMPQPRPISRLTHISISKVEKLYRDPYTIYAQNILRLEPLPGFARRAGAGERGTLIHDVLSQFMSLYPAKLPDNIEEEFLRIGHSVYFHRLIDPDIRSFWWPRFKRIAAWLALNEPALRSGTESIFAECTGRIEFPVEGEPFVLAGRADRIDLLNEKTVRVVDYKTGVVPSGRQVEVGYAPQLTLEAAMIARGAFRDVPPLDASELVYIRLSGGEPAGDVKRIDLPNIKGLASQHWEMLLAKLTKLARREEAYRPWRQPQYESDISDYDHLSRRSEWSGK